MANRRALRILMIHNRYRIVGGEDVSTDAQIDLLRARGHEVELLEDSNHRIDDLGMIHTAGTAIWSSAARRRVDRVLAESKYDVMHVQNFFPLFSPSIYYAARDHAIPVVQSLRNFRAVCPEGMLYRAGGVCTDCVGKRVAWPAIRHRCYGSSARGSAVVAAMATGHAIAGTWQNRVARYVAPSHFTKEVYTEAGWDPERIDVIPNFVFPDPGEADGSGGYVLFAGRLAPVKGIDTLLSAWNDHRIDYPLKIVGEGQLRSMVQDAARANPRISYLGSVDSHTVSDLLGDAALVVVPTLGIESFGRVAVEAMARGTPPIVADHGGLRETVTNSGANLTFPPGDAGALAGRVKQLLSDQRRLDELRSAVRKDFLARFTGDAILDQWIGLYEQVISGFGSSGGASDR
ncbi:MAG: glycosyltransferase family 4 protein [Acidimicrobiia bacterium]|nr:glycosyltransferase family 4 protein [Acidimicrobiia bacterium]